jgi:alpha/beta hydrolase family protein
VITVSDTHFGDPRHNLGMVPGPCWRAPDTLARPGAFPNPDRPAAGRTAYSTSKLAAIYLVHEYARRLPPGVDIVSFNPGFVPGTGLSRNGNALERFLARRVLLALTVTPFATSRASAGRYLAEVIIGLLTDPGAHGGDPADAFDVVVPDMPGYGYSERPTGAPLDSIAVAGLWAELMEVLGYRRFGAAGGDIGSHVSRYLGLDHPDRVAAVHRMDGGLPVFSGDPAELTPEERGWIDAARAWSVAEGGYMAMHRTTPQTLAVGLTDSPAGLAAWIVEKLLAWSGG